MLERMVNLAGILFKRARRALKVEGEMAASRKNIVFSTVANGISANLVGGNFLTGLLILLQADDAFMGLVTMVALAGNLLQVLSPLLLERFSERRKLLIAGRCLIYLFNIVIIGVIPLFGFTNRIKLMAILVTVLFVNLLNAALAPGFAVWHIKSIPENKRAQFYSILGIVNGIAVYSAILAAGRAADHFKTSGNEMEGLLLLRAAAIIFSAADLYFLFKIKEYPNPSSGMPLSLKNVLIAPFKEKKYLVTVLIACMWNFSANIPGPYFSVYMLKDIGVRYSYLNLIALLNVPVLILMTPFWTKRIRRTSWFRGLFFSMSLYLVHYIGLSFVTKELLILYPVFAIYAFLIAPGINLAMSSIPYVNVPEKNQTNFIGFYSAMNNLAAMLGVTLGKEFITRTEGIKIHLLGVAMQNKQFILLLTAALMAAASFTIYLLQKKHR